MDVFVDGLKKDRLILTTVLLYLFFAIWWAYIFVTGITDHFSNHAFGFSYGIFAVFGGIIGLISANKWGGFKSLVGKALIFLSLGLLFQGFGQYSFWYLNSILKIEVPYPGIPDIGFFGTIPFYIYAGILLAKSSGSKISLTKIKNQLQVVIIPLVMVSVGYFLFLRDYDYSQASPLQIFFDFGYPLGQAIYISIALLTFTLTRKILGGIMRFPILFIVFSFIAQFLSDYIYIYYHGDYFAGSFIDYFYLTAYFLMTLSLLNLKYVANKLEHIT